MGAWAWFDYEGLDGVRGVRLQSDRIVSLSAPVTCVGSSDTSR